MKTIVAGLLVLMTGCIGMPTTGDEPDAGCPPPKTVADGEICFRFNDACEECREGFVASKATLIDVTNRDNSTGQTLCSQPRTLVDLQLCDQCPAVIGNARLFTGDCYVGPGDLTSSTVTVDDGGVTFEASFAAPTRSVGLDCSTMMDTEACGTAGQGISVRARGHATWLR